MRFCHIFPFAAKETWTVIVARLCCLTSNGRAGFFCVESIRKSQVQCLVLRLPSQAIDQVFLPILIASFPFQISTPILACNAPSSTSVLPKNKIVVCVPSPEKAKRRCFDCNVVSFVKFLLSVTILDQIIVEAGRSRVPQHPPLHDARHLDVIMQRLQNFVF